MAQRGVVWSAVWAIASLLLCIYIAFDILDLDGSQFPVQTGSALTVESGSAEADRALRASPLPLWVHLPPDLRGHPSPRSLRPAAVPRPAPRARWGCPRRHPSTCAHLPESPDPA